MTCEYAPATAAPLPGDKLPDSIKEKIRLDKYVDFFDIFFPDNDDYHTRTDIENLLVQSLVKKKKRPLTYPEWQSAFFKFTGVYIGFYPHLAKQINAYGEFMNWLQLHQNNWAMYDSNFRKDRETTRTPWTYRRADLQTDAALHSRRLSNYPAGNYEEKFRQPSSNTTQSPWKLGYCLNYNKKAPSAQTATHANGNTPAPPAMKNTRTSNTPSNSSSNSILASKAVTPILTEPLKEMLVGYKDKRYVIQGLEECFDIAYKGEQIGFDANNAHSANSQPTKDLAKKNDRIAKKVE